jgi:hypothetical protein
MYCGVQLQPFVSLKSVCFALPQASSSIDSSSGYIAGRSLTCLFVLPGTALCASRGEARSIHTRSMSGVLQAVGGAIQGRSVCGVSLNRHILFSHLSLSLCGCECGLGGCHQQRLPFPVFLGLVRTESSYSWTNSPLISISSFDIDVIERLKADNL